MIDLGDEKFAIIDPLYISMVRGRNWKIDSRGDPMTQLPRIDYPKLYSSITLKSLVMGIRARRGYTIQNIDGDRLNCRVSNLRLMKLSETGKQGRKRTPR